MNEVLFFAFLVVIIFFSPKIFKDPKLGLVLLVVALPFERVPSFEALFLGGVTVRLSQVIGLILILSFIWQIIQKKIKVKLSIDCILLFLYLLVALASIFVAGDQQRAVMVWLFTSFVVVISLITSYLIDKTEDIRKVEKVLYIITLLVTLFGLFQFVGSTFGLSDSWALLRSTYGETTKKLLGFPRVQAFALEPLYYANFLLIPFCIFLAKSFRKMEKKYLLILFLITINFILTFSRGIYFSAMISVLVTIILSLKFSNYKKVVKNLFIITLGILLGVGMLVFSSYYRNNNFSQIEKAKQHAVDINENSISVAERKDTWDNAIEAFRQNPILGVGLGNFGPWEVDFPEETPRGGWNIVNSEPLEILAETGILGFLSLLAALFYIFIQAIGFLNSSNDETFKVWMVGLLAAFIGTTVQYQTFSTLYIMHVWVLIGLMMAIPKAGRLKNQ